MTRPNGSIVTLGNGDFTGNDLVAATTAGVWHQLAYYDVPQNMYFGATGQKVFFSLEDDA
jgi:hypothetical protein